MKRAFLILYTVLFFLLLCLPAGLFPFFRNDAGLEKRAPAELPACLSDGKLNEQFSDGFESWVSEHLPLRARLLTAANAVRGELLQGQTANVIVGREGWLFFAGEAEDYLGTNALTDEQLRAMAVTLHLIQERTEQAGGRFIFAPVPNKSSVYPEYMPTRYRRAEESNLTRLQAILPDYGVSFTDLLSLLTARREEGVCHRRDSHWNNRGARYGADAILTGLGREHRIDWSASYTPVHTWRGDLDKLLLPAGGVPDEQIIYHTAHADFRFTYPQGVKNPKEQLATFMSDREERDELFSTKNEELSDGSSLLMVRDSFARALLPWMIDSYETATFRRMDRPDLSSLADGTDLVYEIAERNLSRVIGSAPFLYAPLREEIDPALKKPGEALSAVCDAAEYGFHLYGQLPEDADLGDGRIYLLLEQGDTRLCPEAFPILEKTLLATEGTKGFSAYLSRDLGLSGAYTLTVLAGETAWPCGTVVF